MIPNLPFYIPIVFISTIVLVLWFFGRIVLVSDLKNARKSSIVVVSISLIWLLIQAVLSLNLVYASDLKSFPPKIMWFGIFPAISSIILLFLSQKRRNFIDSISLQNLTLIHVIRIPVEIVLYWLFMQKVVPEVMTFEGRNFDILAGISAPIVYYFGFIAHKMSKKAMLIWHFISLGLLLNIVVHALLSVPSPIQKLAFEQPNIAILYFPFVWLPTFIVPVVLCSHIIAIRRLLKFQNEKK